jgi:hypothetical protein
MLKKRFFYIENVYADTKIKNYEEEYHSINKSLIYMKILKILNFPEQFTFKPNKNLIKSNTSKKKFKSLVKKGKNIHRERRYFSSCFKSEV